MSSIEHRTAPVFVRIPHLTHGRSESPRHSTASSPVAERRIDGPEMGNSDLVERDELLPAPQRRVSPAEHALRRLRRELQPATGHSVRNTIILVAILTAATGLTVWMTQGGPTEDVQSIPASALNSTSEDSPSDEDWNAFPLDTGRARGLDDRWARDTTAPPPSRTARVPDVGTWPPAHMSSGYVPSPERSVPELPALQKDVPDQRYMTSIPAGPNLQRESTPVANLINIEPPPARR